MKKEIIIVCIILVCMIVGQIATQKYTENIFNNLNSNLEKLKNSISNEEKINHNMAQKDIQNIQEDWYDKYKKLAFYIEHDELEKVEAGLAIIKASIDIEDYKTAIEELEKNKFILEHIQDKDSFKLVNIF